MDQGGRGGIGRRREGRGGREEWGNRREKRLIELY